MGIAEVITSNEFGEIMSDFTNPLEILREAIQNSFDADAKIIRICIEQNQTSFGQSLDISIDDDGVGISPAKFHHFFNLGDSSKKKDLNKIGKKGHGTKIYFNSRKLTLTSWNNGIAYCSIMDSPFSKIFEGKELEYTNPTKITNDTSRSHGCKIEIQGYLMNPTSAHFERFSHVAVKDYILWFTAFASIIQQFKTGQLNDPKILLKSFDSQRNETTQKYQVALNSEGYEEISFGHVFPKQVTVQKELKSAAKTLNIRDWESLFCQRLYCEEVSVSGLPHPVQIVIWAEGDECKRQYNKLLRARMTQSAKGYEYKVSDRYGFWACKNYIPIQRIDDWVSGKGNYTKFHAFVNYEGFSLTANRSSIENSNPEHIKLIKLKLDEIFDSVTKDTLYKNWVKFEEEAEQERSAVEEQTEFTKRIKECSKRKTLQIGNVKYFEPQSEGETAILFDAILQNFPNDFKYLILDYNTHKGIDYLVKDNNGIPIENDSSVGYIELKYKVERGRFNHSFEKLRQIVCYKFTGVKDGDSITDLNQTTLVVKKAPDRWVLHDPTFRFERTIPFLVLADFLKSKGLEFHN